MQIEQVHFDKDKADLRKGIDKERVNGLIDKLVPPSERGRKEPGRQHDPWDGASS
jgi:hypothetical protein